MKSIDGTDTEQKTTCYHCRLECPDREIAIGDKYFCCHGCLAVYRLLSESGMEGFYGQSEASGVRPDTEELDRRFAFLDDQALLRQLVDFASEDSVRLRLKLPQIHCASCIWLLENLPRLNPAITASRVDFVRKELRVAIDARSLTVRQLVELLTRLGYEPEFSLADAARGAAKSHQRSLIIRLGVAGFAFGNIMLFSFPEYLTTHTGLTPTLAMLFQYANLVLSLPVVFYSAGEYFRSAWQGLSRRTLNIDVPIALGVLVLFTRSVYEVTTATGPGYFDSLAGLVFFLLIGRWFQRVSYDRLSFDRDFRSYFPIAVTLKSETGSKTVPLSSLKIGDVIVVRHGEVIPADAIVLSGEARIDYSFVTGESEPQAIEQGKSVFAGGRQTAGAIELQVSKEVSQSYLTSLWSHDLFKGGEQPSLDRAADRVARYFTPAILGTAAAAAIYWTPISSEIAVNAVTAVLIIACPCALALSTPFALGSALRFLAKARFSLKDIGVVETLAHIDRIVFDKTGTLAMSGKSEVVFEGTALTQDERQWVASLVSQSAHPISRGIADSLDSPKLPVVSFLEEPGKGISATVEGHQVRVGSKDWAHGDPEDSHSDGTHLSIDNVYRGRFSAANVYREGLGHAVGELQTHHKMTVLSGDSDREEGRLRPLFPADTEIHFGQSPHSKLEYVEALRSRGERVMMVGDGLNDSGALRAADVGVAVADDSSVFSPACDAILDGTQLVKLPRYFRFARSSLKVVWASFVLSFLYNIVGLYFAVTGQLSPVLSAILMPVSSVTVVLFAVLMTSLQARLNRVM